MPGSTVLLLSADPGSAELVSTVLSGIGYKVDVVSDPDEVAGKAGEHSLIILDIVSGPKTASEVCREIRENASGTPIPILAVAQNDEVEERIRFLEAGADDVMARPFDGRELEARVEALLLRFRRSQDLSASVKPANLKVAPEARRIAAVFSPKGGVGTTMIATNLAVVQALASPDQALIIDLHLQFGQVATQLNLVVSQGLIELIADESAMREPELLRTYAIRHESGLRVLSPPWTPAHSEVVTAGHIRQILETVAQTFDSVVIDLGSVLDARTQVVFEMADVIIVPVVPEIAALKAVHMLLEYLEASGTAAAKTRYVLNNMFARDILRMRDVESALGTKVAAVLPYDPFLYLKAVNEGVPVVIGAPGSGPTDRLTKLAAAVFGVGDVEIGDSPAPAPRKPRRIGGLLRRSSSRS